MLGRCMHVLHYVGRWVCEWKKCFWIPTTYSYSGACIPVRLEVDATSVVPEQFSMPCWPLELLAGADPERRNRL